MTAPAIAIADSVADELSGTPPTIDGPISGRTFSVRRGYVEQRDMSRAGSGILCTVIPGSTSENAVDRSRVEANVDILIAVQARAEREATATLDALVELLQAVADRFQFGVLDSDGLNAAWRAQPEFVPFFPDRLRESDEFLGLATVQFYYQR